MQDGQPTFTGGGIYVEGNASVTLSTATGPNNSKQQVYKISQGNPAVLSTVVVDGGNNTTMIHYRRHLLIAPPWFPSTSITPGAITQAQATTTVQRVQWLNQSSYF